MRDIKARTDFGIVDGAGVGRGFVVEAEVEIVTGTEVGAEVVVEIKAEV
jgi:hypothetical protein